METAVAERAIAKGWSHADAKEKEQTTEGRRENGRVAKEDAGRKKACVMRTRE